MCVFSLKDRNFQYKNQSFQVDGQEKVPATYS